MFPPTLPLPLPQGQTRSAQTALKLLSTPAPDWSAEKTDRGRRSVPGTGSGLEELMRYAKTAQALAKPATETLPVPQGGGTDSRGYTRSELLSMDQIDPEYAREFASLGATHVVRLSPPELSDEEFQLRMSAALDEMYADDPAYLAAKAEGNVLIQRTSELEAEVPGLWQEWSSFELYPGNEHIGSGGMGIGSPPAVFEKFWADQNAAGTYVMPGMANDVSFIARWPMG